MSRPFFICIAAVTASLSLGALDFFGWTSEMAVGADCANSIADHTKTLVPKEPTQNYLGEKYIRSSRCWCAISYRITESTEHPRERERIAGVDVSNVDRLRHSPVFMPLCHL